MVPRRGLEPPRPCERQHLKLVRLPIPPPGHSEGISCGRRRRLEGGGCQPARLVNAAWLDGPIALPAMDRHMRTRRPGHRLRRRRLHRPLCLRSAAQDRRPGPRRRARPAPRLVPPAARRRSASSASSPPTSPSPQRVARAVEGADAVDQPGRHVQGRFRRDPRRRRRQRRRGGARRPAPTAFVHVSAIGADPDSPSDYGRTKGHGEQAVRAAFPSATIIRPSVVFGPEDQFTNRFAAHGAACRPAGDRAQDAASSRSMSATLARRSPRPRSTRRRHGGKTYEIAGPRSDDHARAQPSDRRAGRPVARPGRRARFRRRA